MARLINLEQAKHNEAVCNYIGKKPEYIDWVVTVAFYSSLHYVRHLILPYEDGGITYNAFETFFSGKKREAEGRHGFQNRFVMENYPEIAYEYQRLYDMSTTSRYENYVYTRQDEKNVKSYLKAIKEYVLMAKPIK